MRLSRLHVDAELRPGATVDLSAEAASYLARVLRLRPDDPLVVFDGRGGEYDGTVVSVTRAGVRLAVGEHRAVERESPLAVTLGLGVSRGERMDYGLQKATELGVQEVVPLLTARCVVQLDTERSASRLGHWRRVVASACEQCGRNRLPRVGAPQTLDGWLARPPAGLRLVLSPSAPLALRDLDLPQGPVTLLVGPEGGLAPAELTLAVRAGFTPLRLGPRVLRTETAVVAALSALGACWGDLGGGTPGPPPRDA